MVENKRRQPVSTEEFRKDSVELVFSSGRPIKEIARELGINDTTLDALGAAASSTDDAGQAKAQAAGRRVAEWPSVTPTSPATAPRSRPALTRGS